MNVPFTYHEVSFTPLRNLSAIETGFENIERRTKGFTAFFILTGYNYDEFYAAARNNEAFVDLYTVNCNTIIIPHNINLLVYNDSVPLQKTGLTYFTVCCGKGVQSHKKDSKNGYFANGKVEPT